MNWIQWVGFGFLIIGLILSGLDGDPKKILKKQYFINENIIYKEFGILLNKL